MSPYRRRYLHTVTSGHPTTETRIETAAFAAVIVIALVPLIWFDHVPTEDGPSHVALATVVASLISSPSSVFGHWYVLEAFPNPNILGTAILVGLETFLSPVVALKVMFGGTLLTLVLAVRYAIGAVSRQASILAMFAIPLGIGTIAHFAFLNFMIGFVFFAFAIGYWHRHFSLPDGPIRWTHAAWLSVLYLIAYLSHLLPFIAALFVPAIVSLVMSATETPERTVRSLVVRYWARLRWLVLAALPSLFLVVAYLARSEPGVVAYGRGPIGRIALFATLGDLFYAFSKSEIAFSTTMAIVVGVCIVLAVRQRWELGTRLIPSDGYLAAGLGLFGLYLVVPSQMAGGSAVTERIAMFAFVVTLLWLANFAIRRWLRIAIVAVTLVATLGIVAIRWPLFEAFDRDMDEYLTAADVVTEGSTVLPLALIADDSGVAGTGVSNRVGPLTEIGSYLTSMNDAIDLNHLHAEYRYSAAHFREGLNARLLLASPPGSADPIYAIPPHVDIEHFEMQTGETVDFVLLWGRAVASDDVLDDPATVRLLSLLDRQYDRVLVSSDRGLMEVYARR